MKGEITMGILSDSQRDEILPKIDEAYHCVDEIYYFCDKTPEEFVRTILTIRDDNYKKAAYLSVLYGGYWLENKRGQSEFSVAMCGDEPDLRRARAIAEAIVAYVADGDLSAIKIDTRQLSCGIWKKKLTVPYYVEREMDKACLQ